MTSAAEAIYLAMGMIAALFEASRSGQGQVVDAAIVDGATNLMSYMYGGLAGGTWVNERQSNLVDGGDWRYRVYECADGRYVSISVLLPKFLRAFTAKIGLDLRNLGLGDPDDRSNWPAYRAMLAERFATRSRDQWMADFDGDDDCVMAVLDLEEAPRHPHNVARGTFVDVEGTSQPAPAPRFSRTPSEIVRRPPYPGEGGDDTLAEWGFAPDEVAALRAAGALG